MKVELRQFDGVPWMRCCQIERWRPPEGEAAVNDGAREGSGGGEIEVEGEFAPTSDMRPQSGPDQEGIGSWDDMKGRGECDLGVRDGRVRRGARRWERDDNIANI